MPAPFLLPVAVTLPPLMRMSPVTVPFTPEPMPAPLPSLAVTVPPVMVILPLIVPA